VGEGVPAGDGDGSGCWLILFRGGNSKSLFKGENSTGVNIDSSRSWLETFACEVKVGWRRVEGAENSAAGWGRGGHASLRAIRLSVRPLCRTHGRIRRDGSRFVASVAYELVQGKSGQAFRDSQPKPFKMTPGPLVPPEPAVE
jgi:hypothetical protein